MLDQMVGQIAHHFANPILFLLALGHQVVIERIVRALRPKVVLAHHHDDFFRPVDAPMGFSFNVNLGSFAEEIESIDSDISLRTLEPLQSVGSAG